MRRSCLAQRYCRFPVITAIAGLLLLAGCIGNAIKEAQLEAKSKGEVVQAVRIRAQAVADIVGKPLDRWETSTAPCVGQRGEIAGDGRWDFAAFANISVPADEQINTLSRIRSMWEQQGYEITVDKTLPDEPGGVLSTRDPETGITMTISTTKDGEHLALTIATPCYMPVPGEDPANDY